MGRPNVVVVMCDQLRSFEVGCYGNDHVRTPNVDRLASEGVRFDLAVSNNPVCTPARSCLLSGQYSRTCTGSLGNEAPDPPSPRRTRLVDPTLPEVLRRHGYRTRLIGKWHVHPDPLLVGFDHALYPIIIHRYAHQYYRRDQGEWFHVDEFTPEFELREAERFFRNVGEEPFFLFYNISLPHEPIGPQDLPRRYCEMYDPREVPLRPNVFVEGEMARSPHWFRTYTIWDHFWRAAGGCWPAEVPGYPEAEEPAPDWVPEDFDLRDLTALYYGAVTCSDDLLGGLLGALERNGLDENTIVVFTSDHGDNLGSHHLFNKDCIYEESVRVPMIVRWPGELAPADNTSQVAQLIDVMPTLLNLCGVDSPDGVQGRDLSQVLRGERASTEENYAVVETNRYVHGYPSVGLRTPTHLRGVFLEEEKGDVAGEDFGLFDMREDPHQERNLLETGEQAETAAELRERLIEWNRNTPWLRT